jgi:hypothetical protein
MTAVAVRTDHDDAIPSRAASVRPVGDLEVPRPLRLLLTFLMLCTVTTIALTVAGAGASALWCLAVLRKLGLRLRFAPA